MKTVILGILLSLAFSSVGYCLNADDVIGAARKYAQSYGAGINLDKYKDPKAVFVAQEDVWIVHFVHKGENPFPDSDFMVKIDKAGLPIALLGGQYKQQYYQYFKDWYKS